MAIPVKLPVFEGPLDLLLHLIEKNKIDIYDIPIAGITDQYLEYVRQMDHEDLDVTSEFLVMAATLLDIKSRMLLPREKDDETGEEEGDPREELVRRLLEYKMYKYLSEELAVYREQAGVRYFRTQKLPREVLNYRPPINYDELLKDADLQSLQKIFGEVLRRKKSRRDPIRGGFGKIRREEISLDNKTLYIRAYLQAHPRTDFRALLESRESREEVIVTFLILLELMKTQKVHIVQDTIGGAILVEAGAPEDAGAKPEPAPAPLDTEEDSGDETDTAPLDTEEDSGDETDTAPALLGTEDGSGDETDAAPALLGTEDGSGDETAGCSSGSFDAFESTSSESPGDSGKESADNLVPTEAISPAAEIREDSAPVSCTGAEVSPVDMPLTAFRRMEIVTSVCPPEGLFTQPDYEGSSQTRYSSQAGDSSQTGDFSQAGDSSQTGDSSQAGDSSPASESSDSMADETKAVFSKYFSSENSLSGGVIPVGETQGVSAPEGELSESTIPVDHMQDVPVSESDQPVPVIAESALSDEEPVGLELTDSSEEADAGLALTDSSEEADAGSVGEHFSSHLWCKDSCYRARYFRTYSGKTDTENVRPPRQWMRARMTRLWARRFF